MKLTKEKQQYLLLIALGTVIVVVALYFAVMANQFDKIAALDKQIAEAAANVDKARSAINKANAIEEELQQLKATLSEIETNNIPTLGNEYSWFVDTLRKFLIPYQNQIDVPFRSRGVVGEVGMFPTFPYKSATFSIRGVGSYHQIGRFLADLENKFQYFRIQKIILSPALSDSPEQQQKLEFDTDIVTLLRTNVP
ncbi:MAG: hypothetical protein ACP5K7_11875 [Verrucomicrobiia bacterium]|jgi:Tfp pilus assembly protein PilO